MMRWLSSRLLFASVTALALLASVGSADATLYGFYFQVGATETSFGSADVTTSGTTATLQITQNINDLYASEFPGTNFRIREILFTFNPTLNPHGLNLTATPDATILQDGCCGTGWNVAASYGFGLPTNTPDELLALFNTLPTSAEIDIAGLPDGTSADDLLVPNPFGLTHPGVFSGNTAEIDIHMLGYIPNPEFPGIVGTELYSNIGPPPFEIRVPEPTTLPLFTAGLALMGWFGWRRKRKARLDLAELHGVSHVRQ
jgi:PEP-CTERM motif